MARTMTAPALALAAALGAGGYAAAGDDAPAKSGFGGGFGTTMTLGGSGTAAQAAAADDTELAGCHKRYYGYGYSSYYGYGGFGGYSTSFYGYGRPYGGYYGGYYGYRPAYYGGYGCGYGGCYRPAYYGGYGGCGFGGGFYYGINGTQDDATAPVVSLGMSVAKNPAVQAPTTVAAVPTRPAPDAAPAGTFRYDGGPANPVPQPKPDAAPTGRATPPAAGLPVSLPKTKPASPYTYKAYGEK